MINQKIEILHTAFFLNLSFQSLFSQYLLSPSVLLVYSWNAVKDRVYVKKLLFENIAYASSLLLMVLLDALSVDSSDF